MKPGMREARGLLRYEPDGVCLGSLACWALTRPAACAQIIRLCTRRERHRLVPVTAQNGGYARSILMDRPHPVTASRSPAVLFGKVVSGSRVPARRHRLALYAPIRQRAGLGPADCRAGGPEGEATGAAATPNIPDGGGPGSLRPGRVGRTAAVKVTGGTRGSIDLTRRALAPRALAPNPVVSRYHSARPPIFYP